MSVRFIDLKHDRSVNGLEMFWLHKVSENKFVSRHERDLRAAISSVDFRSDEAAAQNFLFSRKTVQLLKFPAELFHKCLICSGLHNLS